MSDTDASSYLIVIERADDGGFGCLGARPAWLRGAR